MQRKLNLTEDKATLRRAAEQRLKEKPASEIPSQTATDLRRLQHELEVHQIELEVQNEELRTSQAELNAALELTSDLFDFAPVGSFGLAADGTVLLVNQAGASLVGLGRAELTGRRFQVFLPESDHLAFNIFLQRVFATRTRQAHEITLLRKDQARLHAHLEALVSPDGGSCRLAMFDITERKRTNAVLEARVRLSEYALGHSLDELLTRTLDEVELLTGSTIGFFHFVETDQKTLSLQTWSTNTLRNMCTAEGKGRHYDADKAGVWVDALRERRPMIHNDYAGLPHRKGTPPGHAPVLRELVVPILRNEHVVALLGVGNKPGDYGPEDTESGSQLANQAWDIVLAKRAEEQLARMAREWQATFDAANDAIWLLDKEQRVLRSNRMANQILKCPGARIVGHYCWEIVHGTAGPIPGCPVELARKSLHRETMELLIGDRWYNVTADPILDVAGQFAGAIHIVRDITEPKREEAEKEKLRAQNRQLQKSESLGRMAGAIAHTFNNQLAAVILNLELLQQEPRPDAGSAVSLSEALKSAREAAGISSQMLTYLGQSQAELGPLDLSDICRRSLPVLKAALPQAMVLETTLPSSGPAINANARLIQQMLTNLLTNAWEARRDGSSTIRLTVKLVPSSTIPAVNRFPIDWQPHDPAYACLEVADSGVGIATGDIEKLFDPFFTSKFVGRGLGLAVVLGIAREHGGGITVESDPGQGSVFRIFLPLTAAAVPHKPVLVIPALQSTRGGTLLVIEDDPALRATVTRVVQRVGFEVLAAVDGVEGVELFERHRDEIQCVLCDLTMPRMGGWETLAALRRLAPGLPVVLCSGFDEARVMEGSHAELPQAFLPKPYTIEALVKLINQVWPKVRAEKGNGSS